MVATSKQAKNKKCKYKYVCEIVRLGKETERDERATQETGQDGIRKNKIAKGEGGGKGHNGRGQMAASKGIQASKGRGPPF